MKTRYTQRQTARTQRTVADGAEELRDEIIDWLRDAYAMERAMERALEKQANNKEFSRQVRQGAASHLKETRRHAEAVENALESLDSDTSSTKTGLGVAAQLTKGLATKFGRDERIKDLLDAYAMEHFEIACYLALEAAAEHAGFIEVAEICRRIIPDEERMAEALEESLPDEITSYLLEAEGKKARAK